MHLLRALNAWPEVHPPLYYCHHSPTEPYRPRCLQSPIDIRFSSAVNVVLPPLRFENLLNSDVRVIMMNTGTTVDFKIGEEKVVSPSLTGGPLQSHGEFQFYNIHMHWGMRDILGSEHKVNGQSYAVEGHCVHFNKKYGSYKEASKYHDGLAVVAFFGEAGKVDNPKIQRLVKRLGFVKYPNSSVSMSANESLSWFADLGQPTNYFTYPGSLTTFPYSENVIWIVYPRPLLISFRQVNAFRKLLSSDCMANTENTRPLQEFNCRPLIYAIGT